MRSKDLIWVFNGGSGHTLVDWLSYGLVVAEFLGINITCDRETYQPTPFHGME